MLWRVTALITSVVETLLNKEITTKVQILIGIPQSRLWTGRHQHHDYEDNIMIVLTITKIAQPYNIPPSLFIQWKNILCVIFIPPCLRREFFNCELFPNYEENKGIHKISYYNANFISFTYVVILRIFTM